MIYLAYIHKLKLFLISYSFELNIYKTSYFLKVSLGLVFTMLRITFWFNNNELLVSQVIKTTLMFYLLSQVYYKQSCKMGESRNSFGYDC